MVLGLKIKIKNSRFFNKVVIFIYCTDYFSAAIIKYRDQK